MKALITFLLTFVLAVPALAHHDFELSFIKDKDGNTVLIDNDKDWLYVSSSAYYDTYVDRYLLESKHENFHFYSVSIYKDEKTYEGIQLPVKKIYTFGILSCSERLLYVLNDWYVSKDQIVTFYQTYQFGSFVSELNVKNTIRNDVYNLVCGENI